MLPSSTGSAGPAAFAAPEVPPDAQRIARLVAAHPVLRTGGAAELSLAPEELGHLRLSVEAGAAGLHVVIEAARPETADLMRRHVEALRQELRQEGLGSVSISIGGGEGQRGHDPGPDRGPGGRWAALAAPTTGTDPVASAVPAAAAPRTMGVAGHIDLRF